jgi:hypothetical protein
MHLIEIDQAFEGKRAQASESGRDPADRDIRFRFHFGKIHDADAVDDPASLKE